MKNVSKLSLERLKTISPENKREHSSIRIHIESSSNNGGECLRSSNPESIITSPKF